VGMGIFIEGESADESIYTGTALLFRKVNNSENNGQSDK
jgi:hypothetical protein